MIMTSTEEILDSWNRNGTIRSVAKETGYSWFKVVKALSSSFVIINDTHAQILDYHNKGKSVGEISSLLNLNERTVNAYLPRVRPVYGENQSANALRIIKCRSKSPD